ncbi:MAG: MBL fold metallo-hydrolase [Anaerolineales bacterium]|nr:MBL fold metallo-hydrolase [Anaerolineales bacterium]
MPTKSIPDIPAQQVAHLAMEPAELLELILRGEPFHALDVRIPDAELYAPLSVGTTATIIRKPYQDFEDAMELAARLPEGEETLVICATSRLARAAVVALERAGARVRYLLGGTRAWDQFYDVREVLQNAGEMVIQVARPGRGDLSYIVISQGEAAVIDPLRNIGIYQEILNRAGAALSWVLDTHAHADHISGGRALADWAGVPYFLHPYDAIHPVDMLPALIPYNPLEDGMPLQVGDARGSVIWFPGHTLGLVLLKLKVAGKRLLFTADGVFLHAIGRPDLGGKAEDWAMLLYESITHRLPAHVDDDTLILPGHFASFDEGREGLFANAYAEMKANNTWLEARDQAAFIKKVLENLPLLPESYLEMKRINAGLARADEELALELESGPNLCAVNS